ncbi:MAG: hypothetical protein SPI86_08030 [Treponemataceae bacterium]|nr:hypothetical protein [Spirochaetales bacterium]MDY6031693.1 hypothetical protein [Treponemataceae bacterium]
MKKIFAVVITSVLLISTTFAFGLGAGAKGTLGMNFGANDSIAESFQNITKDTAFDAGGGVYVYMSFLPFLGIQAEANLISSSVSFASASNADLVQTYEQLLLDLSPMFWNVYDLWIFQLAFGVGPNFSIALKELADLQSATQDRFTLGLICGADLKIFFGDHLGLVIGGRFICEWDKTDVPVTVAGYDTGSSYPTVEFPRRTLYGSVGLELKI